MPTDAATGQSKKVVEMFISPARNVEENGTFPAPLPGRSKNCSMEFVFGRYVALPRARTLLRDGNPVCLGSRAFDLLIVLLSFQGKIVTKEAITRYVWPTTTVEESNLRFQITCLRKALGEERDRIKTVTGRGYLFIPEDNRTSFAYEAPSSSKEPSETAQAPGTPAIVIIDGNPDNRESLSLLLRSFDANVVSFVSIEALRESGKHIDLSGSAQITWNNFVDEEQIDCLLKNPPAAAVQFYPTDAASHEYSDG